MDPRPPDLEVFKTYKSLTNISLFWLCQSANVPIKENLTLDEIDSASVAVASLTSSSRSGYRRRGKKYSTYGEPSQHGSSNILPAQKTRKPTSNTTNSTTRLKMLCRDCYRTVLTGQPRLALLIESHTLKVLPRILFTRL